MLYCKNKLANSLYFIKRESHTGKGVLNFKTVNLLVKYLALLRLSKPCSQQILEIDVSRHLPELFGGKFAQTQAIKGGRSEKMWIFKM